MPHWDWMTAAGPPGCRVSALAPDETTEVSPIVLLSLEQDVTFYCPCKTLVSTRDRQSAQFVFDLWSYADVSKHAEGILNRLRDGSMPCDGTWPEDRINLFARWIADGKHE